MFTHTTNRIDVMLSYKLFRHLFSLPFKYFESRRVGETVARNTNNKINIITGLSGSVEIKTGTRSVINYFLDPIKKEFGESLKER
ncbi:MAG: ABC transporter transmembrane domain-containing protein [Oscillospiraceae bacterium]|nr:ABC transporter transmembrane domain-containing protein [Oscillospiraceae bacterium]